MKLTKTLLCVAVAGTIAFSAGKASAFPLTLKFLSGKLTTTAYYGTTAATTTNKYTVKSFRAADKILHQADRERVSLRLAC
jgi:hypothetical protein